MIGEDSALFREGLVLLLRDAGHEVAAAVGDAEALEAAVAAESPDVAIADIRMPPGNEDDGARAAARIRRDHPDVAVMLLSQHVETRHSLDLVAQGGFGYLLKDRVLDVDDFLDALRRVAATISGSSAGCGSPSGRSRRTSAASWESSGSPAARTTTAACSPCSPTSAPPRSGVPRPPRWRRAGAPGGSVHRIRPTPEDP